MRPVPWSRVSSWICIACGDCCKKYSVNISFGEWLQIINLYGIKVAKPRLSQFHLKKRPDGRCIFQYPISRTSWICGLQHMKPKVCKLWPFKILSKPIYGRRNEALYLYHNEAYYIYVDPSCHGISWGTPSEKFMKYIIPEFIQLAFGKTNRQIYSTSKPLLIPCKIIKVA